MADQNFCSPSSPAPVILTSAAEQTKSDVEDSNSLSISNDSTKFVDQNCSSRDENASDTNQPSPSNSKLLFSDPIVKSSSENKNEVFGNIGRSVTENSSLFLRPSILSSGFSSCSSKNLETSKVGSTFSFKSSKLNLAGSKFGDAPFSTSPKNTFSSVYFGKNKNETSANSLKVETNNSGNSSETSNKPTLGIFSSNLKPVNIAPKPSAITVPNFVFGQNLHERVTDNVKPANIKEKPQTENKSNGTSDMLFTSVLTSNEVKDNLKKDKLCHLKDTSSLIEDAARCQEARASKRKYEEVLVTTGEESEQNILQVNVKLFAFDNGTWLERGRGILRLNDKNCEEYTSSRIVIRTVGSLRVVLNTKIWSGMSLNRASERSTRLTAVDPNGQLKIFLIQASLKDMEQLYPLLEDRIKLCKAHDSKLEESPQKKMALEKEKM